MIVRFRKSFALPLDEVFSYFETPQDWTRLFGFAGTVRDRPDGWTEVPLASFPFSLVAKNTLVEENERVGWTFKGFWKGEGEIRFEGDRQHVTLEGYEEISVRWLGPLSYLVERALLQRRFEAVWDYGWRRLRKAEGGRTVARLPSTARR